MNHGSLDRRIARLESETADDVGDREREYRSETHRGVGLIWGALENGTDPGATGGGKIMEAAQRKYDPVMADRFRRQVVQVYGTPEERAALA